MQLKEISFPTFQEFLEFDKTDSRNFRMHETYMIEFGDYNIAIGWDTGYIYYSTYTFAVSTSANPLNAFVHTVFKRHFDWKSDKSNTEEFEEWYNKTIVEFKEFFKNYLICKYFEEE